MGKYTNRSSLILVNILLTINILAVAAIFCSYGAQYIDPRDVWIFALFGLLYPWILISNVCFVILWLFLRKKYSLISLVAILIGWKHLNAMITYPANDPVLFPGQNLNLITWNVHGFGGEREIRGAVRPEVIEYLSGENPDVICLQEFRIHEAEFAPIIRKMARQWGLPYHFEKDYYKTDRHSGINGIATFSKFPVVKTGSLELMSKKCFGIYTDLVLQKDTVRLFNVHLASLRLGQKDIDFYYQLKNTETQNVDLKAGLFSILKKLKLAFNIRASETDKLLSTIRQSPYPVIVCGDLNDSPFSYTYRQLTMSLSDAYREAGEGLFGSTYDGAMPNYRIDFIFYDNHMKAFSYKKLDVHFSDHYPISGLIMLTN